MEPSIPDPSSIDAFDLPKYLKIKRACVNDRLASILSEVASSRLREAMAYSLMAGGKRLRPILCIAAAEVNGHADDEVITAACALECIHT